MECENEVFLKQRCRDASKTVNANIAIINVQKAQNARNVESLSCVRKSTELSQMLLKNAVIIYAAVQSSHREY